MIYLASQSARRKEILTKMKLHFKVVSSSYRERPLRLKQPEKIALCYARGKARCAKVPKTGRFVMAADTVVWCSRKLLGKPKDWKQANQMLAQLSGRWHDVYTAVILWDKKNKRKVEAVERTRVYIKKLSKSAIQKYLEKIDPFDKAGGYAIQEGPRIVKKIKGSYSNVVGLPRERVRKLMKSLSD